MTLPNKVLLTVPFVEVAADERERIMRAFLSHPCLEALLLSGTLGQHLSMLRDTRVLTVSVGSRADSGALERLRRLQMLATRSAAVDHIDLQACRARGVIVTHVPAGADEGAAVALAAVADWRMGREPAHRVA